MLEVKLWHYYFGLLRNSQTQQQQMMAPSHAHMAVQAASLSNLMVDNIVEDVRNCYNVCEG